jgi:lysozyme
MQGAAELLSAVCLTCELIFTGYPPNMSIVNRERMAEQLILHEGIKLAPYLCTAKKLTIGVGYNVSARGWGELEQTIGRKINRKTPRITREEALMQLHADIENYEAALVSKWPFYKNLDEVRQRVVLDLAFNMGYALLDFVNTRAAIEKAAASQLRSDWIRAKSILLANKWARQVKTRATRLGEMLATGLDYSK